MENNSIIENLFSPVTPQDFITTFWAKKTFVSQGPLERLPTSISTLGQKMHKIAQQYTGYRAMTNGIKSPIMIPTDNNVETLFNMGIAVFMSDISPYQKDLYNLLRKLEIDCGCKLGSARIGAFMAPKGSGLHVHYDTDDIISVQLVGAKRFKISKTSAIHSAAIKQYAPGKKIFEELYPQSLEGFPIPESVEHEVVEMKPGTVLYMPKGTWHSTEASDEESISISIGFDNPTALESILKCLRYTLLQDPEWRMPLYGIWGGPLKDQAIDRSNRLLKNLQTVVAEQTSNDVILSESSELGRLNLMDDESLFVKEPTSKVILEKNEGPYSSLFKVSFVSTHSQFGDLVTLQLSDIPEGAADVFDWLSEQEKPFTLSDFKKEFDADDTSIKGLFETAIKGELIRMLWFPVNRHLLNDN